MKKKILPLLFLFSGILPMSAQKWVEMMNDPRVNFYDVQKEFYAYYLGKKNAKNEPRMDGPYNRFKRWEHYMEPRVYPTGIRPDPLFVQSEWLKLKAKTSLDRAANWTFIGPSQIPGNGGGAGKTNAVAIDPTNPLNIWLGSSGGGLWKSTDGGTTWSSNTDQLLPTLTICDIAIDPTNVNNMYIAVREGVFKSTDGGISWSNTGLNSFCYRLIVDPTAPNTLIAACIDGIYRTNNACATWSITMPTAGLVNTMSDLEFNPSNSNIVYACGYTQIFRSTDNGITWTITTTGLPSTPFGIKIAVSPANANYVYALMTSYVMPASNGFYALCRSADAGLTWTVMSTTPNILGYDVTGASSGGQGSYCIALEVSPLNADEVIVGGINLWRSTNGGTTWTNSSDWLGTGATYVHADQQALKFQPGSGNILYSCNDGGINLSTNAGLTWTDLSDGLEIMEIHKLSSSATNPNVIVAGTQDNGSNKSSSGTMTKINYGDGLECIIDYTDSNTIYTSYQYGAIFRSTDGGTTNVYISPASSSNFYSNYSMNPLKSKTLYAAYDEVYRTHNGGTTWTAITSGLYPSSGGGFSIPVVAAPSDTNTIYVGRITELYRTTNGGSSWTNLTTGISPSAYMTGMAVHPTDANTVWIAYSGYGTYSATSTDRIFKTTDGGITWTNITYSGLPGVAITSIIYQNGSPDALYVSTDLGVFYIDNTMSSWIPYNTGLPNVRVNDIDIQYAAGKLRAATGGRGLWETDVNTAVVQTNDAGTPAILAPAGIVCNDTIIPVVELKNFGAAALTSAKIEYQVDAGTVNTFSWTGSIASFASTNVTLPYVIVTPGPHIIHTNTILPNTFADLNNPNDSANKAFIYAVGLPLPYSEGFESTTFPPPGITRNNYDGFTTWQRTTAAAYTGTASAYMDDLNYTSDGMIDELVLPFLDLTMAAPYLSFELAYQLRANPIPTNNYSDTLEVEVSTDCGVTWTQVYKKFDLALVTTTPVYNPSVEFVPTLTSDWRHEIIDLTAFAVSKNVLIRFQNINGRGNQLYLDDINILSVPVGIQDPVSTKIQVYPNPNAGAFTFVMLDGKSGSELEIYSVLGKRIHSQHITNGTNAIDISEHAAGMYFYKVVVEGKTLANGKVVVK